MALERDQQGETVIGFKDRGRRLMAGLVAAALLLAGCAPSDTPTAVLPDSGSSGTDGREAYVEEDTLNAFAGNGSTGDYDPFQSPDELATVSELVISGTVAGVREGRTLYYPQNDQAQGTTSIVLIVNVTEAVKGKLQPGTDGRAYIEFFQPVQSDLSSYGRAFPEGSSVVAYLAPAGEGEPNERVDVAIENPEAGRPTGQVLYRPVSPQGLILQVGGHDVVWPLLRAQKTGPISRALPGGDLIAV
ncbi:hypothetical protein [Arthrobacter sp. R4-81]